MISLILSFVMGSMLMGGFNLFQPNTWGSAAGAALGGVGGFLVGGPAGAVAGSQLGSSLTSGGGSSSSAPAPAPSTTSGNATEAGGATGGTTSGLGSQNSSTVFGNGSSPGLGFSQYVAPGYNINPNAFVNPAGNQGQAWQTGMQNMLGTTTGAAPTAQGANLGQYNQTYGQLQNLAGTYGQMAAGQGPSLAAVTAQQQGDAAMKQQLALAQAGPAGSPALAKYNMGNALGATQQNVAQNEVAGRTQEEMTAMAAQGGVLNSLQGNALQASQLGQQNNQFNATAQANQNALNAQQYNQYLANLGAVNAQQLNANISQQQLGVQNQLGLSNIQNQAYNAAATRNNNEFNNVAGSLLNAVGGMKSGGSSSSQLGA